MKPNPTLAVHNTSRCSAKGGFSFIETLVAITVLLIAVVAPMSLAQEGISAARLSQDQIVAFYLAQEAVEGVKNLRDNNKLDNANPEQLNGLDYCNVETGCILDVKGGGKGKFITSACGTAGCPPIRISTQSPFWYGYDIGMEDSKFTREVKVWYPDPKNKAEAVVQATVSWQLRNGKTKTYTVQNYLYNW